jgi:hypothetical protein
MVQFSSPPTVAVAPSLLKVRIVQWTSKGLANDDKKAVLRIWIRKFRMDPV